ncbi:hypothetical protein SUGI_0014980 [Cryptomeria japonica]|nr:hypothetical protein SUGI_0014980 [Cryptomeria japonica]
MNSKGKIRWVMKRSVIIPFWDEHWDKMETRKLCEELARIESRMHALEKNYFPDNGMLAGNGKEVETKKLATGTCHLEGMKQTNEDEEINA